MSIIRPLVSVITPVYNSENFLVQLIDSTRNQKDVYLEHIIVDDCSTDNSLLILKKLALENKFIKIISLPINVGPVVARNIAIQNATGKYLAFLDADDYWLPHKCITQTKFMKEKGATISFSDYRFISENGEKIGRRLIGFDKINWVTHHITRYLGCLTIIIDKDKYPNFSFPNISPSYRAEDFLAWSNLLSKNNTAYRCPHDLARYRQVRNSRSSKILPAWFSVWKLYYFVELIPLFTALIFFIAYTSHVIWKKVIYKPRLDSKGVDGNLSNTYKIIKLEN